MGRAPCCEKIGLKKGRWSEEEDQKLRLYVEAKGHGCWKSVPKNAGLLRCGKSCRLRWMNYLRSNMKRGHISEEEDQIILNLHATLGNKWSQIATHLPGRSDNEIKNYWNSHLSRKFHRGFGSGVAATPPITGGVEKKRRGRVSRADMKKKNVVYMRSRAPVLVPLPAQLNDQKLLAHDDMSGVEIVNNDDDQNMMIPEMAAVSNEESRPVVDDDNEFSRLWNNIINGDDVDPDPNGLLLLAADHADSLIHINNGLEMHDYINDWNFNFNNWSPGIDEFEDDQTLFSWLWDTTNVWSSSKQGQPS